MASSCLPLSVELRPQQKQSGRGGAQLHLWHWALLPEPGQWLCPCCSAHWTALLCLWYCWAALPLAFLGINAEFLTFIHWFELSKCKHARFQLEGWPQEKQIPPLVAVHTSCHLYSSLLLPSLSVVQTPQRDQLDWGAGGGLSTCQPCIPGTKHCLEHKRLHGRGQCHPNICALPTP